MPLMPWTFSPSTPQVSRALRQPVTPTATRPASPTLKWCSRPYGTTALLHHLLLPACSFYSASPSSPVFPQPRVSASRDPALRCCSLSSPPLCVSSLYRTTATFMSGPTHLLIFQCVKRSSCQPHRPVPAAPQPRSLVVKICCTVTLRQSPPIHSPRPP